MKSSGWCPNAPRILAVLCSLCVAAADRHLLEAASSPITSIADERYGTKEPGEFENSRLAFWKELQDERKQHAVLMKERYGCFCHGYDNVTKWDGTRQELCDHQNDLKNSKFPNLYVVDKDLPPGPAASGVPFDPATMKRHFKQYRAMLAEYYESQEVLQMHLSPKPTDPEYGNAVKEIAKRFVRKIVHGKPVVVGVVGTSVFSGMDNCYHYSYGPALQRAFEPFLKAMGSSWEVRCSGQNGDGPSMDDVIQCAKYIVGDDVDILQTGWMMISLAPSLDYEAFVRRSFAEGMLVHSIDGLKKTFGHQATLADHQAYYKIGMMEILEGDYLGGLKTEELYPWWPALGKAHWGRVGDGRCHMNTREKGAPKGTTIMQDWHPGPLGFQVMMDIYLNVYADAMTVAMDWIQSEGAESLKTQYPLDAKIPVELPSPRQCTGEEEKEHPLCKGETELGWSQGPYCGSGQSPKWKPGANLSDWLAADDDSNNPHKDEPGTWTLKTVKHISSLGQCRDKAYLEDNNVYKNDPKCTGHLDQFVAYAGTSSSGWITFKLPTLVHGDIQLCNIDKVKGMQAMYTTAKPKFTLNGRDLPDPEADGLKVVNHPSMPPTNGKPSTCMQVTVGAPEKDSPYLGVSVTGTGEFQIGWIIAN